MSQGDRYKILQVSPNATQAEIKQAYRLFLPVVAERFEGAWLAIAVSRFLLFYPALYLFKPLVKAIVNQMDLL